MSSIYKQLSASLIIIFTSTAYAKPTQFYKPYKNAEQVENITPKLYKLGETKVHLESKINTADYLTEDKLATLYQEKMTQQLQTKNLLANDTSARVIKLTKTTKHAKRHFWLNDVCTCHGLLPSHSA